MSTSESRKKTYQNPFEPRPDPFPIGDTDPKKVCYAIGSLLSTWEDTETAFSYLFNAVARPQISSYAIRRAYGSIEGSRARKGMIETSAAVFFKSFPDQQLESDLKELMNIYISAISRRNDCAHGIVMGGLPPLSGWYVEANMYSSKRDVKLKSPYAYTSHQILEFGHSFANLRQNAYALADKLKAHFRASHPPARERY